MVFFQNTGYQNHTLVRFAFIPERDCHWEWLSFSNNCSVEIMLVRKPRREPVSDSDGATGAHRLVGARPVEHGCRSSFGRVEKNPIAHGGQGGLPLMLLPPMGERGGHPRNFHTISKNSRGFPMKIELFSYDMRFFKTLLPLR